VKSEGNFEVTVQNDSLRAFMTHLIDYAGLFPPASLTLAPAIQNYAAYRKDKDAWMLGRFIIPAARLQEMDPYVPLFSRKLSLPISALGQRSNDTSSLRQGLRADLAEVTAFFQRHGDVVGVEVFEQPLPPALPDREWLKTIAEETAERGLHSFCEVTVPLDADWERHMLATLEAIAEHNAFGGAALGLKLRTGGVTADAFPTPEQVALVLVGCRDRKIAMKFTAGLHHPIRMHRKEVGAKMHGFLNVFAAGMLAHVHTLDVKTTAEILSDEEQTSFSFSHEGLGWRDLMLKESDIKRLRETAFISYGSCSFDEPREDLRALEILK